MLKHRRTPITSSTKVATLLEEYPELEDVLIAMAPPFKKLRNPVLRKSVAKVASLGQAAAAARMSAADLVNRLRTVVGQEPIASGDIGKTVAYFSNQPDWFDNARIVASIDEREAGDQDRMTVTAVLEAAVRLRKGEIVELITTFVPAPGIDLMKKKGVLVWCVEREPELIKTYFSKPSL